MTSQRVRPWTAAVLLLTFACDVGERPGVPAVIDPAAPAPAPIDVEPDPLGPNDARPKLRPGLGQPIPGLTPEELASFERGRVVFSKRFTPSEGLGPLYNATSCVSCHSAPLPGGASKLYRNFYLHAYGGNPRNATPHESLPSVIVPAFGSGAHQTAHFDLEGGRFNLPPTNGLGQAIKVAQRNAIPIFGTGLFEFVSDVTIILAADPQDTNNDQISGRFNRVSGGGPIGRLGVKAQANNIEIFTRAPLQNQMGITSEPFEGEDATVSASSAAFMQAGGMDPNAPTRDFDGVPDPEISHQDLGDLIAFTRFLAPPKKLTFGPAALRGEALFESIGCALCHVPTLPSSRGPLEAYTDLLLHDMGPDLADGFNFGAPQTQGGGSDSNDQEFRTQPLWGVSLFPPFLHDGRAATLEEAILMHGGEANLARIRFELQPRSSKDDLIRFLERL